MDLQPGYRRVLLVEDEPDVLLILAVTLANAGHVVEAVSGWVEAEALLEASGTFDVLVTDLALQDGDGVDLMALAALQGVPSIAITGDPHRFRRGSQAAASGARLLAKPFPPERLLMAVEHALRAA